MADVVSWFMTDVSADAQGRHRFSIRDHRGPNERIFSDRNGEEYVRVGVQDGDGIVQRKSEVIQDGRSWFDKTVREIYRMKTTRGEYGIEIELEGQNILGDCRGWSSHNDNSLRNGGVEYVLNNPGSRQKIRKLVTDLRGMLVQPGRELTPNYRQSTHVHVNIQEWTLQNVLNFITVFTIFDPLLCHLVGPERDGNLFCLPSHDTGDLPYSINMLTRLAKAGRIGSYNFRGKYASLNMNRMVDFGSLEVRVFPQTLDPDVIDGWLQWIENIQAFSLSKDDKELRMKIEEAWSNPIGKAIEIFGIKNISPDETTRKLITVGAENAYELYHGIVSGKAGK